MWIRLDDSYEGTIFSLALGSHDVRRICHKLGNEREKKFSCLSVVTHL